MRISWSFRQLAVLIAMMIAAGTSQAKTPPAGPVSATLALDAKTAIPGHTLKPGSYSIHVVDHLPDRCILRIEDARGVAVATFIGLLNAGYIGADGLGAVQWSKGPDKTPTLRGFAFANGLTVEFVYPKAEAVELAKLNTSSVPAIDPESEGRPTDARLSDADRQVVTLWTLTATRVGPGDGIPAIQAKRFKPEPKTELAENSVPPPPQAPSASQTPAPVQSTDATASQPVMKKATRAQSKVTVRTPQPAARTPQASARIPQAAKLPQTASELPLVVLLSGLFLVAGLGIGAVRRFSAGS